jgi:hypothetical protein
VPGRPGGYIPQAAPWRLGSGFEIVGVVGQVKVDGLGEPANSLEIYVPITQNPWFSASLAVRTGGDPARSRRL